ncbi:MAG: TIGR00341 family protein, partial [Candidatus Brocadiia bacterium]
MALRLVKMVCPAERREEVDELLGEYEPIALWYEELLGEDLLVCIVLPAEMAEDVLDDLEDRFGSEEGFHIIVVAVEAVVPQPELEEEGGPEKEEAEKGRLSRQELYEDISGSAQLNWTYVSMILLAALIAGIGIWLDNVAVIIGAMVIAPMLDPNMALGLACALGDGELLWRALRTNLAGIGAALALSVVVGAVLGRVEPAQQTFWGTGVNLYHVIVALAAGGAGALAVTRATRSALVGVMVAVALVPPLVALGLAIGSARWPE